MNSNEITRRIWELLHAAPHPDAEQPADETLPIIWADSDPDAWHLSVYPGDKMDAKDREFIWQEFARAVDAVMPAHLPEGVNVVVYPPHIFPDGSAVHGVVIYNFPGPPPPPAEASPHWWGIMSGLLPEVSRLAQHRITSQWHAFQAENLRRMTPAERHAHRMLARLDAIAAARERNRPDYMPPRRAASPPARDKRKGPRI